MKKIFLVVVAVCGSLTFQAQSPSPATTPTTAPATTPAPATTGTPVGINVGNKAPEISLPNPYGRMMSLSEMHGHVVLIDFWASWCGPCRMENPNVVAAYNKYRKTKFKKSTGFEVFSVSLDKDKERWMGAIKQDGLVWPNHVSDLKWWYSDAAKSYGVQSIPTNWLIDENGIIVAKNLRGEDLHKALENLKTRK